MNARLQNRARCGFTLVELLVVIAIIILLLAIIFPIVGSVQAHGKLTGCMENQRLMIRAVKLYKEDHGVYPDALYGYEVFDSSGNAAARIPVRFLYPQYLQSKRD